jgi:large repetitive protein
VTKIVSAYGAFAALRADGSVVTWGAGSYGGDSSAVATQINGDVDVVSIVSTGFAFAAIRADGSVVTWGDANSGGNSSAVSAQLNNVISLFATKSAFAALRGDGSVVTWGSADSGGNSAAQASQLNGAIDVTDIVASGYAFTALRSDGSLVSWGDAEFGGDNSGIAPLVDGTIPVFSLANPSANDVLSIVNNLSGTLSISGTATQGQTLTVTNGLVDTDGFGVLIYRWFADGSLIVGATTSSLELTEAVVGKAISATVSYIDGDGNFESAASSSATSAVLNINDAPIGAVTTSVGAGNTPTQGQTLTASNTLADLDGLGAISYQWNADGSPIGGATTGSLLLGESLVGKSITVTASYTDARGAAESVTSGATGAVENLNDAPGGSVTISGTALQGETLTASNSLTDIDGLGAISYQWLANNSPIFGATANSFVLTEAQVGKMVTVRAIYLDARGTLESVSSAATAGIANINDAPNWPAHLYVNTPIAITQPLLSGGEYANRAAFAVLRADGSVVTWGDSNSGGDSSGVATALNGATDVIQVFSNAHAFAALRLGGSVVTWGDPVNGGDSSAVASLLNGSRDIVTIYSTGEAFAALVGDGSVVTWGNAAFGGDSSAVASQINGSVGVTQITSAQFSFAALRTDGSVVTWGDSTAGGGDSSGITSQLNGTIDVVKLCSTGGAFAALRVDGSVVTWGNTTQGGDSSSVASAINGVLDVVDIAGTQGAFAALRADGSVVTWGDADYGGNSASVAGALNGTVDVTKIISAYGAFAALRADGSVVTWGAGSFGGDSSAVAAQINGAVDVVNIVSTGFAFAALRADGSVVSWGDANSGGNSTAVSGQLVNVVSLFATESAFAALRADGSVVSWGFGDFGGDSSAVASQLNGSVDVVNIVATSDAFAAMRADGKIVTWGNALSGGDSSAVANQIDGANPAVSLTSPFSDDVFIADASFDPAPPDGLEIENEILTASNTLADGDGLGIVSYQWNADGQPIMGATFASLLLTDAQVGKAISVTASYTDAHGTQETITSQATGAIVNVNDAPSGSVLTSVGAGDTPSQGQTLIASNTLADEDGIGIIGYQWNANGNPISGATTGNLLLTQTLVGSVITVTASYTDSSGVAESMTSAATDAVANVNDAPSGVVTISGTVVQGASLSASNTLVDIDGLGSISYQWRADGNAIGGATTSTLLLIEAQVGKIITVTASYTDGYGAQEAVTSSATLAVANVNDPLTGSVSISGTVMQGQLLSAITSSLSDADGLGTLLFQWRADGDAISGANSSSFLLTQAQVGKLISVTVSTIDGRGSLETATSAATAAVANANDAPVGSVVISGAVAQNSTLTASNTLTDLDGITGTINYQWQADGNDISTATAATLALTEALVGKQITVIASYVDGFGAPETVISAATVAVVNVNDTPVGTVSITGSAIQGATLTANNNLTDADGLGSISYQWSADGNPISGASNVNLLLTQAQVGKLITVSASYIDGRGGSESVSSHATTGVVNVNDAPTGSVLITRGATPVGAGDTPLQNQTLTASNNLADIDGLGTITYQWQADGDAIVGATTNSYTLAQAQVGKAISVVATYNDNQGTVESVTSVVTGAVANVNDAPTGVVTINGTVAQNATLTASNSLTDIDGLGSISYQWTANGNAISGATTSTLLLTETQVGKTITVTASYTDGHGAQEAVTSSATLAVANVNDPLTGTVSISGTATQGQLLSAITSSLSDADGLGTLLYQWQADGNSISGATGSTLLLGEAQVGKAITVVVSYSDGHASLETTSSSTTSVVANINDPGFVSFSGSLALGGTLSATVQDADGIGGNIAYQWLADGSPISNATASSFVITASEVGKALSVTANYTDARGTVESLSGGFGKSADLLVYSWKAHTLLAGTSISGSATNLATDANGSARIDAITTPSLTLDVSRSVSAEAAITDSAVNLQDAIAILKMIVGLPVNPGSAALSPYQAIAADFDNNGSVNLSDAIAVLKHVVGLTAPDPVWRFVNEADLSIPSRANLTPGILPATVEIDMSAPDSVVHGGIVGILSGDVDGSFAGAGGAIDLDTINANYFTNLTQATGLNFTQFGIY